ncbi:ribose-5-phosphate isomerase RpiA [Lutibaculum baratangense]|uniref:Ribose-5-phosphate isomerase A n=1 Tax=Lutibaculum baratangense AMV1 TaxID=631454 RepID=V4RI07_9HYPH|nr:ribose-5-phosphate isomerase RpiA [Lutibaculum baratangense]ESR22890.1 Ribose 5-phosphate isomerase A [Lutibaculum baratangense AMV1]
MSDELKRRAAKRALQAVRPGMKLGLGTGSTAEHFVRLLGERIAAESLEVVCVPTSEATRNLAQEVGVPITTLEHEPALDLTVDGADEIDSQLRLIKGGGGALLREKIVASASTRMIVIADESKHVGTLGRFPLPVEVVPFGLAATRRAIVSLLGARGLSTSLELRQKGNDPFVTDNGNYIFDLKLGAIDEPERLAADLSKIPGVVEHGLFIGLCSGAVIAAPDGEEILGQL